MEINIKLLVHFVLIIEFLILVLFAVFQFQSRKWREIFKSELMSCIIRNLNSFLFAWYLLVFYEVYNDFMIIFKMKNFETVSNAKELHDNASYCYFCAIVSLVLLYVIRSYYYLILFQADLQSECEKDVSNVEEYLNKTLCLGVEGRLEYRTPSRAEFSDDIFLSQLTNMKYDAEIQEMWLEQQSQIYKDLYTHICISAGRTGDQVDYAGLIGFYIEEYRQELGVEEEPMAEPPAGA